MKSYAEALALVLNAAQRHAHELSQQASVYERNGTQPIADETLNDHYRPLKNAIATLRDDDVVVVRREVAEVAVELVQAFTAASSQADICERLARAVRLARALERADALQAVAEVPPPAAADG